MEVHASHSGLGERLSRLLFYLRPKCNVVKMPSRGEGGRQIRFGAASSSPSEIRRGAEGARKELICKRSICKVSAASTLRRALRL